MHYVSPFHFLSYQPGQTTWESIDFVRARKRIQAELALNPEAYGGDRNQLLTQLDTLDPTTLAHHRWIFERKPLLRFLEEGGIGDLDWPALHQELLADPARRQFVLTLFMQRYTQRLNTIIYEANAQEAEAFGRLRLDGLTFREQRRWLAPVAERLTNIYQYLSGFLAQMQVETINEWIREGQFHALVSPTFGYRLEALPDCFAPYRDEIILILNQIGLKLTTIDEKHTLSPQVEKLIVGLYMVVHGCTVTARCQAMLFAELPTGRFKHFRPKQGIVM
jgi:hypothetical protein